MITFTKLKNRLINRHERIVLAESFLVYGLLERMQDWCNNNGWYLDVKPHGCALIVMATQCKGEL